MVIKKEIHLPSRWLERIVVGFCVFAAFVLYRFTAWKENEYFWTLSGGYPLWLRDIVDSLYYPFFIVVFVMLVIVTSSIWKRLYPLRKINHCFFVLCLAWLIFMGSFFLLAANNILNFINGRPFHYHDPIVQPYRPPNP